MSNVSKEIRVAIRQEILNCLVRLFPEGSSKYTNIPLMMNIIDEHVETIINLKELEK